MALDVTAQSSPAEIAAAGAALVAMANAGWVGTASVEPPTATQLAAYAQVKQLALRDGGITVNVGTASTPDEVNVASDADGRTLVNGAVQLVGLAAQNSQPAPTFPWINDGGTQITLTGAQMMTIGYKLGAFVQATYGALGTVLEAISAGTITSFAQIDTPPASVTTWPATTFD